MRPQKRRWYYSVLSLPLWPLGKVLWLRKKPTHALPLFLLPPLSLSMSSGRGDECRWFCVKEKKRARRDEGGTRPDDVGGRARSWRAGAAIMTYLTISMRLSCLSRWLSLNSRAKREREERQKRDSIRSETLALTGRDSGDTLELF